MNGKVLDDLPMDLEQIRNKNPIIKTFLAGLVVVIIAAVAQFCVYVSPEQGQPVQEIADTAIEPININTATVEELAILPEITPHLAGKIVAPQKTETIPRDAPSAGSRPKSPPAKHPKPDTFPRCSA